ncbi:ABC transporter ATP-binding protein, partial [Pseudomonas aeruginosa]
RVLQMGGRPGHIRREFHEPLARPRDRRAVELAYLRGEPLTEMQRAHVL